MTTTQGAFYWPPLQNLPKFDVLVFRNAQDVVDYAVTAGNATTVSVANTDTGTTYYPIFASTGAGQKALLFDITTTPFSYIPSTSTLTVSSYGIRTTIPSTMSASGANVNITNNNIGGIINYTVATSGIPLNIMSLSETNTFFRVPFYMSTGVAANSNIFQINDSTSSKSLTFVPSSSIDGAYNNMTRAGDSILYVSNPPTYSNNLTITTQQSGVSAAVGVRITPTSVLIGAGGTTSISDYSMLFNDSSIAVNNQLSFTSATDTRRQINNTFYNLYDKTAIASGTARGRIYSDSATTYIEGYDATHNIVGTENSAIPLSQRVLFNFGSTDTTIYSPNIRLNGATSSNFNIGTGAGDITNVLIGEGTPRTIVYNANSRNTFVGRNAGTSLGNVASAGNTFVGAFAGEFSSNCSNNTFVGGSAGSRNNTGFDNTFIGVSSGYNTGGASAGTGSKNVCVGLQSGLAMTTTASNNTLIGTNAGAAITTGGNNTCVGYLAGDGITLGGNNVFIGQQSGFRTGALGTGNQNTCVGVTSGDNMLTTAAGNSIFGFDSGASLTTGQNNTILGQSTAPSLTLGSNNIVIGNGADTSGASAANEISIGTASETIYIKGGFNYRIGATIQLSITLAAPLPQFAAVAMNIAAQTITLPNPINANVTGAVIIFKRKVNTTAFNIAAPGNGIIPISNTTALATVPIATTVFQVELVCDGTHWNIIGQA